MSHAQDEITSDIRPRVLIFCGDGSTFGPGKAQLLAEIERTGSLNQAAKTMGISYMRAWKMVQTMNQSFREPLVSVTRGGSRGGGTVLTPTAQKILKLYGEMDEASRTALQPGWRALKKLLPSAKA